MPTEPAPLPVDDTLALLHVDDVVVAIAKPAGLLSVPGRGEDKQDCAARRVQARFADALVVHRLDMATSGVLVFARGKAAQRQLAAAFETRQVDKRYDAIVAGHLPDDDGCIDLPLSTDWPNRPRQQVDLAFGKPSITHYRVSERNRTADGLACSRVALAPATGRTHQLRVHLAAIGHPILGDRLYATPAQQAAAPRLLLHARSLTLPHPTTLERLSLHCDVPF